MERRAHLKKKGVGQRGHLAAIHIPIGLNQGCKNCVSLNMCVPSLCPLYEMSPDGD